MRRVIALLMSCTLILTACGTSLAEVEDNNIVQNELGEVSGEEQKAKEELRKSEELVSEGEEGEWEQPGERNFDISVTGLDDEALLHYVEDNIYSCLVEDLNSDEYFVENVEAVYYPKEYIEEIDFNTQRNIYFGYTVEELDAEFQGSRYVFTLGDDGLTTVVQMEELNDDTYTKVMKDVAIGSGVILVCVTVSVVSAGVGAPAISMIFAASATTGTTFALSSGGLSGIAAAITTGYQTEDFNKAIKEGISVAADGFKWGAITGAVAGGATKTVALKGATRSGLTINEAATIQKESGYPLDLIKQFKSADEYTVYKEAGLYTKMVNGRLTLVRDIDLDFVSELPNGEKVTNLVRMEMGYAPVDPATGKQYQLHHINQEVDGTLAILNVKEHLGNPLILNEKGKKGVHSEDMLSATEWTEIRKQFWQKYAAMLLKG